MKLMIIRITNTTIPTAKLPPTRKWPNDSMTWPAASGPVWPSSNTIRVDATFSDKRSNVENSSTAGNAAKSSGFCVYMLTSSTITESAMLNVNSKSSRNAGNGKIIMPRIMQISTGPASALKFCVPNASGRFEKNPARAFMLCFL